jgi:cytochrome oxidase Cu insertion factor (SCO1/SenC/PrrC family)
MNHSAIPYWIAFAVVLAAMYAGVKVYQVEKQRREAAIAAEELSLPPLTDFELTKSDGMPFRSADMKGKVWIASYFFSTCPGSCKRLNQNIKYLSSLDEIADADWVSITVDPATDTLPVLEAKAKELNADPDRWYFCRGEFDDVRRIAHDYMKVGGVSLKGHNDYAVIIDKQGEIAGMFNAVSTSESKKGLEIIKRELAKDYVPKEEPEVPPTAATNEQRAEVALAPEGAK